MTKLLALLRREYLEHRGAFLIAPAVLLGIFTLGIGLAIVSNRVRLPGRIDSLTSLKFYEIGFLGLSQIWWWYLLIVLFFYFADSFSADRRNNAMLFWKSMPVSDLGMLLSKVTAGLILFPLIIFAFLLLTGIVLYLLGLLSLLLLPELIVPAPAESAAGYAGVAWFDLCHFVLGLLWFAPFFAWVGALSIVFRRWSIPLSVLIPLLGALLENAAFFGKGPVGGYIYSFLSWRMQFGLSREVWGIATLAPGPVNLQLLTTMLVSGIDWLQMGIGLVVTAVLVVLASLYRRRGVAA